MSDGQDRKIVVITRLSRLDELIGRFNTQMQASFYVKARGGDIGEYVSEAETYKTSVAESCRRLEALTHVQRVDREHVPNFSFGKDDVVVVIGQDGLVVNVLKYLNGQPLIAVNPDPDRYEGGLLPFRAAELSSVVGDVLRGRRPRKEISMASAELNDGQTLLAVNDFFIGRKTHVSARYTLCAGGRKESQSSSGIIVSTGLGSSGWLRSVLAGAAGVADYVRQDKRKEDFQIDLPAWDSDYLYYSVREPFPSLTTGAEMVFGKISGEPLRVISQMPENGVIFSDGIEQDFLQFNSGIEVKISVAKKKGYLIY